MPFTSVHYIVDMELLPILVFTFFTWKSGAAIHFYKQTTTRFMLSFNCSDQHVSSLLHCAALSRESLDVTFSLTDKTIIAYGIVNLYTTWMTQLQSWFVTV